MKDDKAALRLQVPPMNLNMSVPIICVLHIWGGEFLLGASLRYKYVYIVMYSSVCHGT